MALYLGRRFKFIVAEVAPFISDVDVAGFGTGRVMSVVVQRTDKSVLCFKFYDCDKYRVVPAPHSDKWRYMPCTTLMSDLTPSLFTKLVPVYGQEVALGGFALVNRRVVKYFPSHRRWFEGIVRTYSPDMSAPYFILYDDGDKEDMTATEVLRWLRPDARTKIRL